MRLGSAHRRLRATFLVIAFVISIFAGRLVQLQGIDSGAYAAAATANRLRTVEIAASRGGILDANGVALADTTNTVAVAADPVLTTPHAPQVAGIVAGPLGLDEEDLYAKLTKPGTRFVYLKKKVTQGTWRAIRSAMVAAKLTGVFTEADPYRFYPNGSVASNVIGFLGGEDRGLGGLEQSLNGTLAGTPGHRTYEVSADGPALPFGDSSEVAPKPGRTVQLTIDGDVQFQAQQLVAAAVKENKAESGDAVVMDVRTGEIVAMATAPTFDPNEPIRSTGDAAVKEALDERRNRPVTDAYEPGSVFKILTAAALLDQGLVTTKTKEEVPGTIVRNGWRIKDAWSHGDLNLTFAGAIAKSSNIGTLLAAEQMSKATQASYLRAFGIGQPTGLPLPGQTKGILSPGSTWSDLGRATISFGQGVSVSAVQLTDAIAAVANGGVRIEPQLIKGYVNDDGTLDPAPAPTTNRVVSRATARTVLDIMEQVTDPETGLGKRAHIDGYRVAGKTGTAQRADSDCGCYRNYTVSFAAVAPADSPRYVVYVDLKNVGRSASGGGTAAPVVASLLKYVLQKYKVPPSGSKSPQLELTW